MPTDADWDRWVDEANDALACLSGCAARWWGFGPPCCTFQLVVGDPVGTNVAIMLTNARFLAGPTMWQSQTIRVSRLPVSSNETEGVTWLLQDVPVHFRAESGELFWAKNIEVCDPTKWLLWYPPSFPGVDSLEK